MRGGVVAFGALTVRSGAELELDGDVKVTGAVDLQAGAKLTGSGVLYVASLPAGGFPDVELGSGVSIVVAVTPSTGKPVYDYPVAKVVGDPAFWFSADTNLVAASGDEVSSGSAIRRWNDCRGTDAKYMFATNVASVYPTFVTNTYGQGYVKIAKVTASKSEIGKTAALLWNRPLSDIRHVFLMHDTKDGGGSILGSSPRIATKDFNRKVADQANYYNRVLSHDAAEQVKNAKAYYNGVLVTSFALANYESGYPYYGSSAATLPILIDYHTTANAEADCFGFMNSEDNDNGGNRIHECLVYTNELTVAEQLQVREYLMMKYLKTHAHYERLGDVTGRLAVTDVAGAAGYDVGEDQLVAIDSVTGSGRFDKIGAGELYVDDLADSNLDVRVRGGRLSVRSVLPDADHLPVEPVLHVDASDAATTDAAANGGSTVTYIADRRGLGYPVAVCAQGTVKNPTLPLVATAGVQGKTMLDFGPYKADGSAVCLNLTLDDKEFRKFGMHSLVGVFGTAQGGGILAGDNSSRNLNNGGLFRESDSPTNALVRTDLNYPYLTRLTGKNGVTGVRWRVNGVETNYIAGFSGGYDLVSLACAEPFSMNALMCGHYAKRRGGQELGEEIFFDEGLSKEQVMAVEAYLNRKWFNKETAGYRGSAVKSLDVAAGAEVSVCGNSPLKVGKLTGAGSVAGAISFADGGEIVVDVADDGSVSALSVGSIDLSESVTVRVTGAVNSLEVGETAILVSDSIKASDSCAWTLVASGATRRSVSLKVADGAVKLTVSPMGLLMIVR